MPNTSQNFSGGSATGGFAITPHDATLLAGATRFLWVTGTGDLSLLMLDGSTVALTGVPANTTLWVRCVRVNATGTTATGIVGFI